MSSIYVEVKAIKVSVRSQKQSQYSFMIHDEAVREVQQREANHLCSLKKTKK